MHATAIVDHGQKAALLVLNPGRHLHVKIPCLLTVHYAAEKANNSEFKKDNRWRLKLQVQISCHLHIEVFYFTKQ